MRKTVNTNHIAGWIYQHDLAERQTGPNSKNPGTDYISGTISVVTDDAGLNVVPIHFSFVTPTTKNGGSNATYNVLKNIINGVYKTVMSDGKDNASKIVVDTAIDLNEFYSDRSGTEELVSVKRNEGGFVHIVTDIDPDEKKRNKFTVDMLITSVVVREAEDDKPAKATIKGAIFNFRNALLPVEFAVYNPNAIAYFEGLGASAKAPVFTKVAGRQISETVVNSITEECAFEGEALVRETPSSNKEYVITWAATEPYAWDEEGSITAQELTEAMAARQTYLATLKARNDEYKASRNAPAAAPAEGGFNF